MDDLSNKKSFREAYNSRDDLKNYGSNSLSLFALQLRFGIEDIETLAQNAITDGSNDKKADIIHIDAEAGYAVIIQSYISQSEIKKEAQAQKASDLNTAVSWMLGTDIAKLPDELKLHAEELRSGIKNGEIKELYLWYVHNLPESKNVKEELDTVHNTANAIISSHLSPEKQPRIICWEVGSNTLEEWYKSILNPILVLDELLIPLPYGGFEVDESDWKAFITTIPAKCLFDLFKKYDKQLFSANVRDYLGIRKVDENINNGIKNTSEEDPEHFLVYNNGITALVHDFEKTSDGNVKIRGLSIVNGAQTTGAIGNSSAVPSDRASVQVRFIKCSNNKTVQDIVKYNNSQNRTLASDFRSNDNIQRRLLEEFSHFPKIKYIPRRGGVGDIIRRVPDALSSIIAGQTIACFQGDPENAYHNKTRIWETELYNAYFNEQTNAKNILCAYSLLRAIENKKLELKKKGPDIRTKVENKQFEFFSKRGSIFLLLSAISKSLEIILSKRITNHSKISFKKIISPEEGAEIWKPIVEICSSFAQSLSTGLSDGFRTKRVVDDAIENFQSLMDSTKEANSRIYATFSEQIN